MRQPLSADSGAMAVHMKKNGRGSERLALQGVSSVGMAVSFSPRLEQPQQGGAGATGPGGKLGAQLQGQKGGGAREASMALPAMGLGQAERTRSAHSGLGAMQLSGSLPLHGGGGGGSGAGGDARNPNPAAGGAHEPRNSSAPPVGRPGLLMSSTIPGPSRRGSGGGGEGDLLR